jgi:hypothetical protein
MLLDKEQSTLGGITTVATEEAKHPLVVSWEWSVDGVLEEKGSGQEGGDNSE